MAILYIFTVDAPDGVESFPPSVMGSEWYAGLVNYCNDYAPGGSSNTTLLIFADQPALEAYISQFRLTDEALLSDIELWKTTHGVTYSTQYYALSDATITPPPLPIIT